jgi:hypothetical protein
MFNRLSIATPYHLLEVKVAKMQAELERITSVPIPIGEMWLNMHMQLMGRVETNEKGMSTSLKTNNFLAFEADKKSLSKSFKSA